MFDGIAELDMRQAEIERQIAQIELEAQAAQLASQTYTCPRCGTRVSGTQGFCSGCGMPVADIVSGATMSPRAPFGTVAVDSVVSEVRTCVACGAPLEERDVFCMSCGARQPEA